MKLFATLLIGIFLFCSCLKDAPKYVEGPSSIWNPDISIALGYSNLMMNSESGFDTTLLRDLSQSGFPDWIDLIDIPLNYSISFDFGEITEETDDIERVMFRINTANSFPVSAEAQVYLVNSNDRIIDSLFSEASVLEKAMVEADGRVVRRSISQTDIVFEDQRLDNLENLREILMRTKINNMDLDTNLIPHYTDFVLDIQVGLQIKIKTDLSNIN